MYDPYGRKDRGGRIGESFAIAALTTLSTLVVNDLYTEFQIWRKKQAKRAKRQADCSVCRGKDKRFMSCACSHRAAKEGK